MADVVAALEARQWDVVLVDQESQDPLTLEVLEYLHATRRDIPLLVIAGTVEASSAIEAMARGVKDFVLKRSLYRLSPAVLRELAAAESRQRQRESMRLNEALNEINLVLHSSPDTDEVLQRALDEACMTLSAENGTIELEEDSDWVICFQHGLAEDHRGERFSSDQLYVLPAVLKSMSPVVLEDLQSDPRYDPDAFDRYAIRSTMAIPLTMHGRLFGLAFISRASSPSGFTPEMVDFGRKFGAAVSLAMQNADAIRREREYAGLSDTLSRINEILLEPFDPVTTMSRVVAQALALFNADSARIVERAKSEWVFAHIVGDPSSVANRSYPLDAEHLRLMQPVLEGAQSLFVEDLRDIPYVSEHGYGATIALPLVVRDEVVAVLSLGFMRPRRFGVRERQFAERLRSAVSLALENEEHLREESSTATLTLALERAESGIYNALNENEIIEIVVETAATALCATGACAIWAEHLELVTVPRIPQVTSLDVCSSPSLSRLIDSAGGPGDGAREHAYACVIEGNPEDGQLLAIVLSAPTDRLVVVLERHGGEFDFRKEELSFAARLGEVGVLAMENLRLARDRESLVATREEWLAGISHDLRTPLAAVRGYAELLASGGATGLADVRDQSQRILEQTDRIERMIVDMLLAFRIRANALPVTSEPVALRPLLEDVRRTVLADRRTHGRRIELSMASDLTIVADPALLERAVSNLALNAVIHNAPGVLVSLWAVERDGRGIVQVADNGRGIDETTMGRLFVRYERASASGEGAAGAGLGMPIARQLVEAMGGTLEVESAVGVGTTATISLPLSTH